MSYYDISLMSYNALGRSYHWARREDFITSAEAR